MKNLMHSQQDCGNVDDHDEYIIIIIIIFDKHGIIEILIRHVIDHMLIRKDIKIIIIIIIITSLCG